MRGVPSAGSLETRATRKRDTRLRSRRSKAGRSSFGNSTCRASRAFWVSGSDFRRDWRSAAPLVECGSGRGMEASSEVMKVRVLIEGPEIVVIGVVVSYFGRPWLMRHEPCQEVIFVYDYAGHLEKQ